MLDINTIRDNPEKVRENLKKRENPKNLEMLEKLMKFDEDWRRFLTELNRLRHQRSLLTTEIADLKKREEDITGKISEAKKLDRKITALDRKVKKYEEKRDFHLMRIPNLLHESVPKGKDEQDNVPIRVWGDIPKFEFPVKDHIDLASNLSLIDLERARKVAGARFFYLKQEGVRLDMALINFALDEMIKRGHIPIQPPLLMRREPYEGVIALSDFEEDLYKIENEELYLIATSEHPMAAMFIDEVLTAQELPVKMVGVSTNFRKEAGTHGRDTRGIFRTHQFNKVEQFVFCKPEDSWDIHEELIRNAEYLIQKLGLPYRVVNVCTGDIGTVAAKKYDIEVWMPAQNAYREVISCSNCTDYQARRLNIRYREKIGAPPKEAVHTLNSTAIATGRTMVAILENYQQEDGSVIIPKILRKYMDDMERIESRR